MNSISTVTRVIKPGRLYAIPNMYGNICIYTYIQTNTPIKCHNITESPLEYNIDTSCHVLGPSQWDYNDI